MTELDRLHAALLTGGEADGLAFYRALADAELFLLLDAEAEGEVMAPRVFDLAEGAVLLAFDSEERLAGFASTPMPYAALPGRVIAGQMAGQGPDFGKKLSLGLNLGTGAASEVLLPPEALAWLMEMLDQAPPEALEARIAGFEPPAVPDHVMKALLPVVTGARRAHLVGVRYRDGRRGQMLALVGVETSAEAKLARAVTEALAFSGVEAGALDVVFLAEGDAALGAIAAHALTWEAPKVAPAPMPSPVAPGSDPARPPILR